MNGVYDILKVAGLLVGLVLIPATGMSQEETRSDSVERKSRTVMPYKVRGKVTDAMTGKGFAGVSLTSPNLDVSAMTDEEGNYEIGLPSLKVSLAVTAPGYERLFVSVRGREVVNITMNEAIGHSYYDDVTVSAGETVVEGFSEGSSSMPEDLSALLNGQVRAVSASGEPGSSSSFFIRGLNSIHLSSQPLFVVDGVIWQMQEDAASAVDGYYNNPLTLLDPSDIECVKVLKNGSAIWGAKGANGVVEITTKRAREMATQIDANISVGFQTPFKSIPVMGADAYRRYATDVMSGMDKDEVALFQFVNDDPTKSYYRANHNNTDWLDEVNKTSLIQKYGISVSGGDDKALYRFSLGYAQNDGNIDGSTFNRLNVRFNTDIMLTKKFKVQMDIAYAQTGRRTGFTGLDAVHSPYFQSLVKSPLYAPYEYNTDGTLSGRLSDVDELNVGNPLVLTGDNLSDVDKYRFNLNFRPSYQITDRLEAVALFGFSWDKENENMFLPDLGLADAPIYNEQGEVYAVGLNEVRDFMARQSTLSVDAYLGWDILKSWKHSLNARIGGRFYNTYYHYTYGRGYNTGSDFIPTLEAVTNDNLRLISGTEYQDRNAAWYLNAGYNYLHKYFLNAGLSIESSSRFGKKAGGLEMCGVSWGVFPTVSAAWLISSEDFMKQVDFINNLKLRVAYTMSGNDNLPLFANRSYFTTVSSLANANGLILSNIGNESLKWETTGRVNVGLDFSLLNDRLTVNADYFHSKTKDLLTRKSLNEVAGMPYYWDNDGELENRGVEVAVRARAVEVRDFEFDLGLTLGHYKNKITSLDNGDFITDVCGGQVLTAVNQPVGVFYGYRTNGIYTTAQEASDAGLGLMSASGQRIPFSAGDVRFVDVTGDKVINENDRVVIGNPNPDLYGNFNLDFKYKRLALSALFTYSLGNDAYNALRQSLESGNDLYNQSAAMDNRWRADGQQTDIPRAVYGDPMGNSRFSDRWIEDASFLKFKRLTLSYDIPFRTTFLQNIRIWAAVNNLCTLTKYLGGDPEFSYGTSVLYQGVDAGLIPQSRSYQLGVNISL